MSQEDENYGYGIDIGYLVNRKGTIDVKISESGDLQLVGAGEDEALSEKRKNAIQQIILRILTPFGTLQDQNGNTISYGSQLHSMIGTKDTELNRLAIRAYVLACLQDYQAIESILEIIVEFPENGVVNIGLRIKLKDDDEILFETITLE